eukprot:m.1123738 g.1123738  ORF g.1123738 m.1123738 type:complete len:575 (-) comp24406_c2_seq5:303-2027(-)
MEASCMQLSIEGERLLKAHDYQGAIDFFEAGIRAGTDDKEVLSAVYNQLGNACFYIGKFHKALEYHKKDLEIAQALGDKQGQAKAFGNLGNTFKSLKSYDNAIRCCEDHLRITKELKDRLGEGRACYNLGNVHHAVGKSHNAKKTPDEISLGHAAIKKAIEYYKTTLTITKELQDTSGEGRAVGNLGNAYTAIGMFKEAIVFHERRLEIAESHSDLAAKARACGNLGNAYSALQNYSEALKFYKMSLAVAKDAGNLAGQGQAYYCIGTTYTMLKNHNKAIEFHEMHLKQATELNDKQGIIRSWFNIRNSAQAIGDKEKRNHFHHLIERHKEKNNIRAPPSGQPPSSSTTALKSVSASTGSSASGESTGKFADKKGGNKDKNKKTNSKTDNTVQAFTYVSSSDEDDEDDGGIIRIKKGGNAEALPKKDAAMNWLDSAIAKSKANGESKATSDADDEDFYSSLPGDDFFDMLLSAQSSGLSEQRATAPEYLETRTDDAVSTAPAAPDASPFIADFNDADEDGMEGEALFEMLVTMQSSRLDSQRAAPEGEERHPVVQDLDAENMSFFEMLGAAGST